MNFKSLVFAIIAVVTLAGCNITVTNEGGGTVTSDDGNIYCGDICEASYSNDTLVTLTAEAFEGFIFQGWSGVCEGTESCEVSVGQASGHKKVTAMFEPVVVEYPYVYPSIEIVGANVTSSTYSSGEYSEPITYMIGVYETHSNHSGGNHPMGNATVNISEQPSNIILVLSSYEPVTWDIQGEGADNIERLIVHGYHDQVVIEDNLSISAEEYTHLGTGSYISNNYYWPQPEDICRDDTEVPPEEYSQNNRICNSIEVQENIEALIGQEIDVFAGTYSATEFNISIESSE
ncbi:MAG: hypothetical protein COA99_02365 [Moraxellaceae bacterium]|nr:MAG: hypothetical protein COA99_02365 [Moraxellaceae bacterium]